MAKRLTMMLIGATALAGGAVADGGSFIGPSGRAAISFNDGQSAGLAGGPAYSYTHSGATSAYATTHSTTTYSGGSTYMHGATMGSVDRVYRAGDVYDLSTPNYGGSTAGHRADACYTGKIAYGQQFVDCPTNWRLGDKVIVSDSAPMGGAVRGEYVNVAPTWLGPATTVSTQTQTWSHAAPAPIPAPAPRPTYVQTASTTSLNTGAMTGGVGVGIGQDFYGGGGTVVFGGGARYSGVAARSPIPIVIIPKSKMPSKPAPKPCCHGGGGKHY